MFDVNFDIKDPQVVCHPQYQELVPRILEGLKAHDLKDHFILFSSGTTGGALKGYAVSKSALFANAQAVNKHFALTKEDVWGLSLPVYHIGGLSVLARAHLLGNKVIDVRRWNPENWVQSIAETTITTIVPTQLYDLVKLGLGPSSDLKYLIVGGDHLNSRLKEEALSLGWPVIRTFGMSEVCSQLASSQTPLEDKVTVLPIHTIKTNVDQRLLVKSPALFTLQFTLEDEVRVTAAKDLCDKEGFYLTSDRARISGGTIEHLGRLGDEFKAAGHLVNMNQLRNALGSYLVEKNLFGKMEFMLEDDERKGKKLVLLSLQEAQIYAPEVAPLVHPVKIDEVRIVPKLKRTDLGKLKKS